MRWHRAIEGQIKTLRISKKVGKWYASFSCVIDEPIALPHTDKDVAVGEAAIFLIDVRSRPDMAAWFRRITQPSSSLTFAMVLTECGVMIAVMLPSDLKFAFLVGEQHRAVLEHAAQADQLFVLAADVLPAEGGQVLLVIDNVGVQLRHVLSQWDGQRYRPVLTA